VDEAEYDIIEQDITEEQLIKILEEMDYVVQDDITVEDHSGIADLLDLITGDNTEEDHVDYDYKITGGEVVIGEEITNTEDEFIYPDIDYQDTHEDVEATDETNDIYEDSVEDEETEIVWVPAAVVEYDYEIVDMHDIMDIFDNDEPQLDYQEDQNYQEARYSSVKFETIYQEQRIFNIILLAGVSLICLIIMFGLISLAISLYTRSTRSPSSTLTEPHREVKLVKSEGIVKSYARLPTEVKNMLPSNVAYKHLYDVWVV